MTLKEIQAVALDILKDVHQFCVAHDIHYTLFAGTLIGAIRHQGFIPWDDDVDVAMPRKDYDRFVSNYQSENGYQLFCRERHGKDVYISHGRVCDMTRTFDDDAGMPWMRMKKKGVWIDIFPLDGAEPVREQAEDKCREIMTVWKQTVTMRFHHARLSSRKGIWQKGRLLVRHLISPMDQRVWARHLALCKAIPFEQASCYSQYAWPGLGMREYYRTSAFDHYQLHPFEDGVFYVIGDYDGALRAKYGDYMQLPPEEERLPIHSHANAYYWLPGCYE